MRFRSYDNLRVFNVVARLGSLTAAAAELHLTKGAISYQISQLERELGFAVFAREHRRISLTRKGEQLWHASGAAFDGLEREIARLRQTGSGHITIAMSTYFASRWLSPRLMTFIDEQPHIRLRLQPLVNLYDLGSEPVDMVIRWGTGQWADMQVEPLLLTPAFPAASKCVATRIEALGIATALREITLLHDRDGSKAWADWHRAAALPYHVGDDALVIPDPNVRVEAVVNGQGIALQDSLVASELGSGTLARISDVELDEYGYFLCYPANALEDPSLRAFHDWIVREAADD